ncbi:hypothetical protein [Burkholderia gladioli]|uniref:hypothetical protein n=1 Tax=Burkholderia gladioli TaxID=28095 RepID=UPI001ABB8E8D|nr:hypothetical protein [Burkholderia gladioli]
MTNDTTAALTDEQINAIANDGHRNVAGGIYAHHVHDFARDVERALVTAPRAGLPRHVLASLECTAVWLEKGNDPQDAARELRACLAKIDAAPAAPVAEAEPQWLPINFAPDDDELIWLMKGDSIEGPRRIHPNDYDRYTHYAPCEAPSIKSVRAQAVAADGAATDQRAQCIEWALANGFTKYHDSMCAAWEEATRRAAVSPATADERARQVSVEGWTPEHDDQYTKGELALAASQYVLHAACPFQDGKVPAFWPWPAEWWKPTTPRRDLEKAGALIQAEIERLYRAEAREQGAQGGKGGEA